MSAAFEWFQHPIVVTSGAVHLAAWSVRETSRRHPVSRILSGRVRLSHPPLRVSAKTTTLPPFLSSLCCSQDTLLSFFSLTVARHSSFATNGDAQESA